MPQSTTLAWHQLELHKVSCSFCDVLLMAIWLKLSGVGSPCFRGRSDVRI